MAKYRVTFEEFSERIQQLYNGRIIVDESTYHGLRTGRRVKAHCIVHNVDFEPEARSLWKGETNCPLCRKEKSHKRCQASWEVVLQRFRSAYGDKFSYDESTYDGMKNKMIVYCNDCGVDFEISPVHHLKYNNGGCPNCQKHRVVKCSGCGKEIIADYRIGDNSIIYCDECRHKNKLISKYKSELKDVDLDTIKNLVQNKLNEKNYCKICGRLLNENRECDNDFCKDKIFGRFRSLIKYFNFDETKLGTVEVENEFNRIRDILYDMYWIQHMSSTQICEIFGYPSVSNLSFYIFKILNIPSKNHKQSIQENFLMGRLGVSTYRLNYKSAYHTTWDGKRVYLRSSYELDYAQILDENEILYEVENIRISYFDTQEQCERIAIPDFYLPMTNTIVEIKSSWTLDVINMIDRVKAYKENGYDFKLILEHNEVDIYSLTNEPKYKGKGRKHLSLKRKTRTSVYHEKWHWMNDGINNYKVLESQIDEYKSRGLVFGCLMNVRNKSKQDNHIIESLT